MRHSLVAGQFYEEDKEELEEQIRQSFLHERGPRLLPLKDRNKNILGVISPHAGYMFSGPGAAWSFKEIAESKIPDLYILLGLSHSGYGSCLSAQDWETPFGIINTDKEFIAELSRSSGLKINEKAHQSEHSIEVQLPFLQFANMDFLSKIRIAPIICSPDRDYKEIAENIKKTLINIKKKSIIIASSDFTHYGFNYGYFPFRRNIKENMCKLDKDCIEFIEKFDAEGFLDYISKTGATICGNYPIAVLIELSRLMGAEKAKLLSYYTSGDIVNDYSSAVGYASIVVE